MAEAAANVTSLIITAAIALADSRAAPYRISRPAKKIARAKAQASAVAPGVTAVSQGRPPAATSPRAMPPPTKNPPPASARVMPSGTRADSRRISTLLPAQARPPSRPSDSGSERGQGIIAVASSP